MPTARLSARFISRRAAVVAAAVAAFLAAASFVNTRTTRACPPPPVPLRTLYLTSDLVVAGSVGETTAVELVSHSEENSYENYLMRTDLKVSSTVKGAGNYSLVRVYHPGWKREGRIVHPLDDYADGGNKLLVFLRQREGGDGYQLVNIRDGVKSLTDAALKVYVQRLDELDSIMRQQEPDPARIVEWLVRCVEEPETRWEGLYELTRSNYALIAEKREAEEKKIKEAAALSAEGEKGETNQGGDANKETEAAETDTSVELTPLQSVNLPNPGGRLHMGLDSQLIKLLTAEQKSRLANLLFGTKTITNVELPLVNLVRQWDDPRLVPFLISQLRGFKDDPPGEATSLVTQLAEILGDGELSKLAQEYCLNAWHRDPDPASAFNEGGGEAETAETESAEKDEELSVYGSSTQRRSVRLQRFMARAETVLVR
ncbi:MAG TPA: hypothetical protein VN256_17680 [Pyrinomonadaceae bacterium]|nr:hypothetical protein [Pyrinomonadaceae bacterium]